MRSKFIIILLLLHYINNVWSQNILSENIGNPTSTTSILLNNFQNIGVLNYSNGAQTNSADVRNTSASSGYIGASGTGNVYFTATSGTYGFSIEGINASYYSTLSLQFGYRKEAATSLATFSVDYWNGTSWNALSNLFNESANATAGWYLSKVLSLPTDAQINGLKLRFVKTGTVSIRIDDIKLSGVETLPSLTTTSVSAVTYNSATFGGNVISTGGTAIAATGTVYSMTATNPNPSLGGIGVNALSTLSPSPTIGTFSNDAGNILSPNVQYSYNAYATKSNGTTGYGNVNTFYTLAVTPTAPVISSITATKLNITLGSDSNSALTTYTIKEITTGKYVQTDGSLNSLAIYQTKSAWSTLTVTGLNASTSYSFSVMAKNGDSINTSYGALSTVNTLQAPIITTSGTLSALNTIYGTASSFTSFSLSATNLTSAILITPPSGFELSQTISGASGYSNTITLNPISGTIGSTTIYVRLAATTGYGNYSGTISILSANDGITTLIPTVLSTVSKLTVYISGVTVANKTYDGTTTATVDGTPIVTGILASDISTTTVNSSGVTANFSDPFIGTAKLVTVLGYSLNGAEANNYLVTQPSGLTANVIANASSDIVFNSSSSTSSNSNIDYKSYQGTTLTSTTTGINGSVGVMGFYIRDGGSGLNDADNLDTELTDITFNVTNSSNIRSARLFIGTSARGIPVAVNGASTITFTGLTNIIASDNSQLAVNLRITFNSTVTDNQQMQFTITSVTSKTTGSKFAVSNGGGATSSIVGDVNRIEVMADRLAFIQQPSSVYVQSNMSPAPSIEAKDSNGNRDLDYSDIVNLTSSGTLNSSPISINAINGVALFNTIYHTNSGTGFVLSAYATGLAATTSSLFDVKSLLIPTFNAIAPVCSGTILSSLPVTSLEGITGTWSPALNNTATTTYTFTPNIGQNADNITLLIIVNPIITPTFNSFAPCPYGSNLSLPTISNNGITGTWSPAIDNTTTTTYTFTPNSSECASITTLSIVIIPPATTTIDSAINSIHKIIYKTPTSTSSSTYASNEVVESVVYYDGLGRPIQQKLLKQSNTGKDIVTPIEYDLFGRQSKSYLPYVNGTANPDYESNAISDQAIFYSTQASNFENTAYAYSEKTYENSPLNRILKISAPGDDWRTKATGADNTIKLDYQINSQNEVRLFNSSSNETTFAVSFIDSNSYYQESELYKSIYKNENWKISDGNNNTIEEFKDKEGRLVLKRTYGSSEVNGSDINENHDTYYVYDQFSNLTFVIPPMVDISAVISQTVLDNLCYQYKYDNRNRLIEKKLPGKDWEFIVYDKLDRVVASGPVKSPFKDASSSSVIGWKVIKYDVFNRVILTGWIETSSINSIIRSNLQSTINLNSNFSETFSGANYTNIAWPTTGYEPLTLNYYDNYNGNVSFTTTTFPFISNGYNNSTALPKGLPTLSWVRVLENKADMRAERTYIIYDQKGRVVTSFSNNYLDGYTQVDNQMEFITGRVNQSILTHKKVSVTTVLTVTNTYSYSDQDRLIFQTHQIGNGVPQLMSRNEYSELGQLIVKRVGSKTSGDTTEGLQKIDYSYNSRGWLKGINDIANLYNATENDLFAYKLNYNTTDGYFSEKQYNGNISEVQWRTATDNTVKQYSYTYDELNRLKTAIYSKPIPGVTSSINNSFGENAWYDKNGNITHLERYKDISTAPTNEIDDLVYHYATNSNQLKSVDDLQLNPEGFKDGNTSGDDYSYDSYGNLVIDKNKGIVDASDATKPGILYNDMNLPTKILFGTSGTIEYLYNAVGKKLQKKVTQGITVTTTDYLDGFQYQNNVLTFFASAEGYVQANGTYVFQYKDHLDNVRVSYVNNNGTAQIIDENNYYPFGLKQDDYYYPPTSNNYKYNGKELQEEFSLNMTSMDYRQYDNALGRFNIIDPLAEETYSSTIYGFAGNNPVMFSDPSGLRAVTPQESIQSSVVPGSIIDMLLHGMTFGDFRSGEGSSGGGGGNITHVLQQQMWGPSFSIGTDGFVKALTTNYSTGERGYWQTGGYWNYTHAYTWSGTDTLYNNELGILSICVGPEMTLSTKKEWIETQTWVGVGEGNTTQLSEGLFSVYGPAFQVFGSDFIPKNSSLAKFIFPTSRVVGDASKNTSLASLMFRRITPKSIGCVSWLPKSISFGGQLGRTIPVIGNISTVATTIYDYEILRYNYNHTRFTNVEYQECYDF
jgi:RHS repeat-associated protein